MRRGLGDSKDGFKRWTLGSVSLHEANGQAYRKGPLAPGE